MTSTELISSLDGKIKEELSKIEQRLRLSSAVLQKHNISEQKKSRDPSQSEDSEDVKKTKKLQDEVLQQLGQLYNLFNSRSASAVTVGAGGDSRSGSQQPTDDIDAASLTPTNNNSTMPPPSTGQQRKTSPLPSGHGNNSNLNVNTTNNNNNRTNSPTPTFSTTHANQAPSGANITPTARSGTPPPSGQNNNNSSAAPSLADYNTQRSASSSSAYNSATATPTSRSGSPSSTAVPRPPPPPAKGGMLWNYGLPSLMRSFKHTYVVISTDHVKWYKTEESYKNGDKEIGSVQLWAVQKNSRGSVIKNTAAGWPYISPQDCPKATDPSRYYFGVQYFDAKDHLQHLVLAATSADEKREWVNHIAQLIPLQLPPDAPALPEGQLYIDMATNVVSHHCKKVLDGEAPKF